MNNQTLLPTLRLSLDMTKVLARMEQNGIKVNKQTLKEIRDQYQTELYTLESRLTELAANAMGDTPINLASADDRSKLFYSCAVRNKSRWASIFNLGMEIRGAGMKPKRRTRMSRQDFNRYVVNETDVMYKTKGSQCTDCGGKGRYTKRKKDGTLGKAVRICKTCGGKGVRYESTGEVAGFKLIPRDVYSTAAAGFKTDKITLEQVLSSLRGEAREFAESYIRYSAVRTYVGSFLEGMENNMDANDIIHTEFMQCVTATGRLSSRNPNFQNMPRGNTFEIRRAVESRFEGGSILEGDYSQLEFRVAGFLAGDETVMSDVQEGTDVHSITAGIIGCTRQEAKAHTFKPLYGGTSGTDDQKRYYNTFKTKYAQVAEWQDDMQKHAVMHKYIQLPSGRQYAFPYARWTDYGTATDRTLICNYPVQGFATADLLPMALVLLDREIIRQEMKSIICNTVHDSIVLDVYPGEEEKCVDVLSSCMLMINDEAQKRYGIFYDMPIGIELKIGKNWLDSEVILEV